MNSMDVLHQIDAWECDNCRNYVVPDVCKIKVCSCGHFQCHGLEIRLMRAVSMEVVRYWQSVKR
jgi:hypothetical protein